MEKPRKYIQQRINQCLDELIELGKDCSNTELPVSIRQRGLAVLNNIFKPAGIEPVSVNNLSRQLKLISDLHDEELRLEDERIKFSKRQSGGWFNRLINLFNQNNTKNTPAKTTKPYKLAENRKPAPLPKRPYSTYEPNVYGRSGNESYPRTQQSNKKNPPPNHTKIEHFSNVEMRSRQDEKRLDGSPDPYAYRDQGLYGSHPMHDDYTDESQA